MRALFRCYPIRVSRKHLRAACAVRKLTLKENCGQNCVTDRFGALNSVGSILSVRLSPTSVALKIGWIIELDGSQHMQQVQADQRRSRYLEQRGYRKLRFWDNEVLANIDGVMEQIVRVLNSPHPNPLPGGEGTGQDK